MVGLVVRFVAMVVIIRILVWVLMVMIINVNDAVCRPIFDQWFGVLRHGEPNHRHTVLGNAVQQGPLLIADHTAFVLRNGSSNGKRYLLTLLAVATFATAQT